MSIATLARFANVSVKNFSFGPKSASVPANMPAKKSPAFPRSVPLADFERQRLRDKIAAVTCSSAWSEHVSARAEQQGVNPNAEQISRQLADRGIYPPRPDLGREQLPRRRAVRMRRCDTCGRIVPPNNLAAYRLIRLCDDCRIEPDLDLDTKIEKSARAPGAHLCTLMQGSVEGPVDDDATRNAARQQLAALGLTDAEVLAMSLVHVGYSTRRVGELGRWSQTYVRKLLTSASRKLRRSGLQPPTITCIAPSRAVLIDPVKLDGLSTRVR